MNQLKNNMQKVAVLILCHKDFSLVERFINQFSEDYFDFFIHVDKKVTQDIKFLEKSNVYILCDCLRVDVKWGGISQVEAILNLLNEAMKNQYIKYLLASGSDILIKNSLQLYDKIATNEHNYITLFEDKTGRFKKRNELFYFNFMLKNTFFSKAIKNIYMLLTGGKKRTFYIFKRKFAQKYNFTFSYTWFCFSHSFVKYIFLFLQKNSTYKSDFRFSLNPDESFFATILINSPYKDSIKNGLTYVDWSQKKRNPKILTIKDFETLMKSDFYLARKFDINVDLEIINKLTSMFNKEQK